MCCEYQYLNSFCLRREVNTKWQDSFLLARWEHCWECLTKKTELEKESRQSQTERAAKLISLYYAANLPEGTAACKLKSVGFFLIMYL